MAKFATLWFWNKGRLNDKWREIYSFTTNQHPKPSLIESDTCPCDQPSFTSTYLDNGQLRVRISNEHLPNTPSLWYLHVTTERSHLPTQTLSGFATDHFPDGTVASVEQVRELGLTPKNCISAIQWGLYDPKLYQIYVHEEFRRKRIGTKMINACDILHVASGRGGFIYGGDQVTELGKKYGEAWIGSTRRRDPEMIMPDMD